MAKFYEYYRSEVSESELKVKSILYISEISSGVYAVEKDRFESLDNRFVSSSTVAMYLNNREKVVIERLDGFWVSNYDFK